VIWRYRKVKVDDGQLVDIPDNAKCMDIRPLSKRNISFVEWLEPVTDEAVEYPTFEEKVEAV